MTGEFRTFVLFCLHRCFSSARIGEQLRATSADALNFQSCPYCGGAIDEYERVRFTTSAQSDGWSE